MKSLGENSKWGLTKIVDSDYFIPDEEKKKLDIQSSLLKKKSDAFNLELSKPYKPYYDRNYQIKPERDGGNPFAGKRNEEDQLETATNPHGPNYDKELSDKDERWFKEMGVKSSKRHRDPEFLPPREDLRDYGNEEVAKEQEKENEDSDLKISRFNPKPIERKLASLPILKMSKIEAEAQCVYITVPKFVNASSSYLPKLIENTISIALDRRVKYASRAFLTSGTRLEFLIV